MSNSLSIQRHDEVYQYTMQKLEIDVHGLDYVKCKHTPHNPQEAERLAHTNHIKCIHTLTRLVCKKRRVSACLKAVVANKLAEV